MQYQPGALTRCTQIKEFKANGLPAPFDNRLVDGSELGQSRPHSCSNEVYTGRQLNSMSTTRSLSLASEKGVAKIRLSNNLEHNASLGLIGLGARTKGLHVTTDLTMREASHPTLNFDESTSHRQGIVLCCNDLSCLVHSGGTTVRR